jgi:hypothetical protein
MRCRLLVSVGALLCVSALDASAQSTCNEATGKHVAGEVAKYVNILADFTTIACMPSNDQGRCSLVCVTTHRISAYQRQLLLTTLTAAAGKSMREAGLTNFTSVTFVDRQLGEERRYARLSAARASELQQTLKSERMTLDQFRAAVEQEFAVGAIPVQPKEAAPTTPTKPRAGVSKPLNLMPKQP